MTELKMGVFFILSYSLYHVSTTFFHHRHALTLGSSSQTETCVGDVPHLQCKQLHRASHFNPAGIVLISLFITCSINSSGTLDAGTNGLEPSIIPVLPRAVRIK